MQRLDVEIEMRGFTYKLLRRGERVALYSQFCSDTGVLTGFELFEIPTRPEEKIKDKVYPEREVYPPTSRWGRDAFTLSKFSKLEKVLKRFEEYEQSIAQTDN